MLYMLVHKCMCSSVSAVVDGALILKRLGINAESMAIILHAWAVHSAQTACV